MPAFVVNIKQEVLKWILDKAQYCDSIDALNKIKSWLYEEKQPTFRQIEEVSSKTRIPFGYFFLDAPIKEEFRFADFRTKNSDNILNPSRDLIDTVDAMSVAQSWMSGFKKGSGFTELSFLNKFDVNSAIDCIVKDIRFVLNIDQDWFVKFKTSRETFNFLRENIEKIGILVMQSGVVGNNNRRALNIKEFRAFCLCDSFAPLIFINATDSDNGKVFSLVHETAHIWINKDHCFCDKIIDSFNTKTESMCNLVASEILVPKAIFLQKWEEKHVNEHTKIDELSKFFKVSKVVIARKALDLKKINKDVYVEFQKVFFESNKKAKQKSKGNFYRTLLSRWSKNFLYALNQSVKSGQTMYLDAYRMIGVSGKSFDKLVSMIEGI